MAFGSIEMECMELEQVKMDWTELDWMEVGWIKVEWISGYEDWVEVVVVVVDNRE